MTVWNKPVSWHKFKMALECPRQLQYTLDTTPPSFVQPNYHLELGTVIQFCFEQYFNQEINLKPRGDQLSTIEKVTNKILASQWYKSRQVTYPYGKNQDELEREIRAGVIRGFETFAKLGILKKKVRSEVKWNSVFRGLRLFGLVDFVVEAKKGIFLFDGKGHARKDADERQLLYYALTIAASGRNIAGGGYLYWKHDYQPIDLSPRALKEFIDGPFTRGQKIFKILMQGTDSLPADPAERKCRMCPWKWNCPSSTERREEMNHERPDLIGFRAEA